MSSPILNSERHGLANKAKATTAIFLASTLFLFASPRNAFSCMRLPPAPVLDSKANGKVDAVLRGIVVDIKVAGPPTDSYNSRGTRTATLKVVQVVKGNLSRDAEIGYLQSDGVNCGDNLEVGDDVWVRASRNAAGKLGLSEKIESAATLIAHDDLINERRSPRLGDKWGSASVSDNKVVLPHLASESKFDPYALRFHNPRRPNQDQPLIREPGTLRILVSIDAKGKVTRSEVQSSTFPPFNVPDQIRDAMKDLHFIPGTINGTPTPMQISVGMDLKPREKQ